MTMGWMDVFNPKAGTGYYYANQDPETRLTLLYLEMRPFTKSASVKDNWPSACRTSRGRATGLDHGLGEFSLPQPRHLSRRPGRAAGSHWRLAYFQPNLPLLV